jgi:hypothetical protein
MPRLSGICGSFRGQKVELRSTGQPGGGRPLRELRLFYAQALGRFFVEEAFALPVRLEPFAVDYELGDSALAGLFDHFIGGAGSGFDIDVLEGDVVALQEAFGFAAFGAPEG